MKHKQRLGLLITIFFGVILAGCVNESRPPSVREPVITAAISPNASNAAVSCKIIPAKAFDSIVFSGNNIHAIINGHQLKTQVLVSGSEMATHAVRVIVKNGILFIYAEDNFPVPAASNALSVNIELSLSHDIQQVTFNGSGTLQTKNIGHNNFSVNATGNTQLSLQGDLVLSKIYAANNALVHAYWLNTSNMTIQAKNQAKVFVAGIATNLNIVATGDSEIDAKYLRTQNAFVKASGAADVAINVKRALSVWSINHATVYSYRDPLYGTTYLSGSGAALRMAGLTQQ